MFSTKSLAAAAGRPRMFEQLEHRQLMAGEPFQGGNTILEMQTTIGDIWIELYDKVGPDGTSGTAAPITTTNFLRYVDGDRYDNSYIHRVVNDFVVQGGGYKINQAGASERVESFGSINNEFSSARSNLARTLAMAKLPANAPGGGPDSATSEWFINLEDTAGTSPDGLDFQNGGFTVFAKVVVGWDVVLRMTGLATDSGVSGTGFPTPVTSAFNGAPYTVEELVAIKDVVRITSPGYSQQGAPGKVVSGATTATGDSAFGVINSLGRAIVFYKSAQATQWEISDLNLQTASGSEQGVEAALTGNIQVWNDPKDGRFYAVTASGSRVLLWTRNNVGTWSPRNLVTEIFGSTSIASNTTVFISQGDTDTNNNDIVQIAGTNAQGNLVLYYQSSKTADGSGNFEWSYRNISTQDLTPQGFATPTFASPLVSWVYPWNGRNIAALDNSGNLQAVWIAPGLNQWQLSNLSQLTGAPTLTGGVTVFVTPWGGGNIAGTDAAGNVVVTWWGGPGDNDGWATLDFTDEFSGPQFQSGSTSAYVTSWGGLNIVGRTKSDSKMSVYWWGGPGDSSWEIAPLSDVVTGSIVPVGATTGVAPGGSATISILGLGPSGDVLRYHWTPGQANWNFQNLTSIARYA